MVQRSNNNSNTNGGVAYANANNDSSNTNSNNSSRLAFRGECTEETDVTTFKKILVIGETDGVFIQDIDGKLWTSKEWNQANSRANGVAVLSSRHPNGGFVISKTEKANGLTWGSYKIIKDIVTTSDASTAKKDYLGRLNTEKIIEQDSPACEAAIYCKNFIFPNRQKGYLGSRGEWYIAGEYRDDVEACMSLVGGSPIDAHTYSEWTSTQNAELYAWVNNWKVGESSEGIDDKTSDYRPVRPFTTLQ